MVLIQILHLTFVPQFFEEAAECEQWMSRQADSINIRYSDDSQSVETLQTLIRELQELSDQVAEYERRVSSLAHRSREIIPLKQRGQPVFSELRCRCLCIYKQPPVCDPCLYLFLFMIKVLISGTFLYDTRVDFIFTHTRPVV